MPFPRSSAFRSPLRSGLASSTKSFRSSTTQSWQRFGQQQSRRGYASGGSGGLGKYQGDLPWAVGSALVTIPGLWWVLSQEEDHHADHDSHGAKHDEEGEGEDESKEEETKTEDSSEEKEEGDGSKEDDEENKQDGGDDEGDAKAEDKTEGDESKGKTESNRLQGTEKGDRNSKPVKILDQKNEGDVSGSQASKQKGHSNTETKHSTDPTEDGKSSTKSEGTPETSKTRGTVDPSRPQK